MKIVDRLINQLFKLDLQTRLIAGFLIATCLTGFFATLIGTWTINRSTIAEVQDRVQQDINTAKLIYNNTLERIVSLIQFSAEGSDLNDAMADHTLEKMEGLRGFIRSGVAIHAGDDHLFLDMITVVDHRGNVLFRAANPGVSGDNILRDPVVKACIEKKTPQASTELMSIRAIMKENPGLQERVTLKIIKTPLSFEYKERELTEGMVMRVAYPIMDKKKNLVGALVGGVLINQDNTIVDKIKETVYKDEIYKDRPMGVATIFQGGVRISTNVMTQDNKRAIGTTLSREVYDRVIVEGKDWVGRAFVVNDWYITTYTPIYNMNRDLIGILYTGILEAKYTDIKWRTIWINLGITTLGMIIAFFISFRLGNTIITRIRMLKEATEAIAAGNLDYKLSPDRISGFDMLDEAFNYMSKSLKDRDERLHKAHDQLARTEKLTALGEMAAGVAHEINNPLGGILLYSNLVLEDLPEDHPARPNLEKIIYQTNRSKAIVQNLLDFARTPAGNMMPLSIADVIMSTLALVKDQSIFLGIEVDTRLTEDLPPVRGDYSRLEEVFLNLFVNAADAMAGKGVLKITTRLNTLNSVRVSVSDTGKGIERSFLQHIFEPFFTTKDAGQGTGLGLSIAYGIIREHNGTIDVESEAGRGTTFVITLPACTEPQERREDA